MYAERSSTWAPPREFGEYVVERCLGGGAMGTVYLARDHVLDRPVAIKFIAAAYPSAAVRERFMVEARAAARMSHPNVAAVHRVGDLDGHPYLVSEFVEGDALSELSLPLSELEGLRLAVGVARGLAEAHRHGVLHRDIKPANILVGQGGVAKLVDFGLAQLLEEDLLGPKEATADIPSVSPTEDVPPSETGAPATTVEPTDELPSGIQSGRLTALATGELSPVTPTGELTTPATLDVPGASPLTAPPTADVATKSSKRAQTRAGVVMGTPDYMPPEVWRGEVATPASDVYALGAVLYELLTGAPPFAHVDEAHLEEAVLTQDAPRLSEAAPHVRPRVAELVDRCLRRAPTARFSAADGLRDELEVLAREKSTVEGNPFRGLQPFEAQHRATFFGRETETDEIVGQMGRKAFVIVTGDSGTGKSSVCRASVVPACTHSGLGDGRSWAAVTVTPGPHPLSRVCAALSGVVRKDVDVVAESARKSPGTLATQVQAALGRTRGVVCFVDQLEELLTQNSGEDGIHAERLLAALASGFPGIRVLATARADFLTRLAGLSALGPEVPGAIYLLRAMTRAQVRRAIEGPTHAAELRFESESLIEELLDWGENGQTSLPILQFTLSRWWEARDRARGVLTREGLESIGGVEGALAQQADRVMAGLVGPRRELARQILITLVGSGGVRITRNVADFEEGDDIKHSVLDQLVAGRLLAVGEGPEGATVTLVHDVLVRAWSTLADWVGRAAATTRARERLLRAAKEWESLGRPPASLLRGSQIAEAVALPSRDLGALERRFLSASRGRARRQRLLRVALALAVPLSLAAVYIATKLRADMVLDRQVNERVSRAEATLNRAGPLELASRRARRKAEVAFRSLRRQEGETLWQEASKADVKLAGIYREANQDLESAVALAPDRTALRARFADLLFARVRLADRRRAFEQRDELLVRLALYDEAGGRLEAWRRPGTVRLEGLPAEAELELDGKSWTGRGRRLAEPGSHRVQVRFDGLRYALPFVLEAGEALRLDATPPSTRYDPAYIYVPAGRFKFGSTAGEDARLGFFDAPPVHTATTAAYWIGRHEVTFAEWIAFLEDLPAEEAERYRPGGVDDAGLTTGAVRLERDEQGWRLTYQTGATVHRVRAGETVRYGERTRRAEQDWLRFPVVAVTAVDAEAYTQWLDRTGRLPGARLCSEHEWERASRGADARRYPHGDRLEPDDINFDQTYAKKPGGIGLDEVGSHPRSRSPFGVDDLAGNAFEWTRSSLDTGQYVLRGGSYFYDPATNRSTNRSVSVPSLRVASVGVRVCAPAVPRK